MDRIIINPYQQYYSDSYSSEAAFLVNRKSVETLRNTLRSVPYRREHKVLDIACGVSILGKAFGGDVYGMDMNRKAVRASRRNGIKANVGDVEKQWRYPNDFFDVVIASHIIEHVVNPDHVLREAKRVLKPNGYVIIITPNLAAWFNRILLLFGFQPFFTEVSTLDKTLGLTFTRRLGGNIRPLGRLRLYTPGALRDIMLLHGFIITETQSTDFGSFPAPLAFIDKLFSRIPSLAACLIAVGGKL